jgi:hypothetical protein
MGMMELRMWWAPLVGGEGSVGSGAHVGSATKGLLRKQMPPAHERALASDK